ncbi:L,D-transpeptidase [Thalassovita taeanensis]|uniref:L,D-transpeptidase catalytic domain n=1 Tax=Thalassovita taeanensis TaxID=657014 RepID=A0A1H9AMH0_9RHOB|nr:L,D-transpeptidase [Thalassovita taeanensis]SEP77583.1 L,D-transpeptidase catalytic domain [Thalassovita taeanensis]
MALLTSAATAAQIEARVDLSDQLMTVSLDGQPLYVWPVSTARFGKVTPVGNFTAQFLSRDHYSSLYHHAPMPFSIFFYGNYAIHGTTEVSRLGTPASSGCIRLHPENAQILFAFAQQVGLPNTHVVIQP